MSIKDSLIAYICKSLNGEDVNVADCMYRGKKKYVHSVFPPKPSDTDIQRFIKRSNR